MQDLELKQVQRLQGAYLELALSEQKQLLPQLVDYLVLPLLGDSELKQLQRHQEVFLELALLQQKQLQRHPVVCLVVPLLDLDLNQLLGQRGVCLDQNQLLQQQAACLDLLHLELKLLLHQQECLVEVSALAVIFLQKCQLFIIHVKKCMF